MGISSQFSNKDLITSAIYGNAFSQLILSARAKKRKNQGLQADLTLHNIRGINENVTISGGNQMISDTGNFFEFPVFDDKITIDYFGTLNHTIFIEGLDANYNYISEIINFTTGSTQSINNFLRINYATIISTEQRNDDVYIHINNKSEIKIVQETNEKRSMNYTVPAGYSAIVIHSIASVGKNTDANIIYKFRIYTPNGYIENISSKVQIYQNKIEIPFNVGLFDSLAPEKTDIILECDTSSNNTIVSAANSILEVRNDVLDEFINQINIGG